MIIAVVCLILILGVFWVYFGVNGMVKREDQAKLQEIKEREIEDNSCNSCFKWFNNTDTLMPDKENMWVHGDKKQKSICCKDCQIEVANYLKTISCE